MTRGPMKRLFWSSAGLVGVLNTVMGMVLVI